MYRPGEGGTAASTAGPPPVEVAAPGPASTPSIGITRTPFTPPTLSTGSGGALNGSGRGGSQAGSSASLTGLDPATTTTAAAAVTGSSGQGGGSSSSGSGLNGLDATAVGGASAPAEGVGGDNDGVIVEVLLACGNSVMFFGEDGKPLKK